VLVFLHLPRTGGTTLGRLIDSAYGGRARSIPNYYKDPARTLVELEASRDDRALEALYGHAPFDVIERTHPDATLITIVRDPFTRVVSQYRHYVENSVVAPYDAVRREGLSIRECVRDGRFIFDNVQTRMLSGSRAPFGACPESALSQAKANLDARFAVAGTTERYRETLEVLRRTLDWPEVELEPARVSSFRPTIAELPRETVEAIQACNELDLELHRYVTDRMTAATAETPAQRAASPAVLRSASGL
jgi:hypothetical protein